VTIKNQTNMTDNTRSCPNKNETEFPTEMASHSNPHEDHRFHSKNVFEKMRAKEKYFKSRIYGESPDRPSRFVSNYSEYEHPNLPYQY